MSNTNPAPLTHTRGHLKQIRLRPLPRTSRAGAARSRSRFPFPATTNTARRMLRAFSTTGTTDPTAHLRARPAEGQTFRTDRLARARTVSMVALEARDRAVTTTLT